MTAREPRVAQLRREPGGSVPAPAPSAWAERDAIESRRLAQGVEVQPRVLHGTR